MSAADAVNLLRAALHEVAATPSSMSKLARAAATRPNIEMEWVYELDGTTVLQGASGTRREVNFGARRRADLLLADTLIEFKSTRASYAVRRAFEPQRAAASDSVHRWLAPDMVRMEPVDGVFVLLMCTPSVPVAGEFKDYTLADLRSEALDRYRGWTEELAGGLRAGALVEHCHAGHGLYDGVVVTHDALLVHWAR